MLPADSQRALVEYANVRGIDLRSCSSADIALLVTMFYREIRAKVWRSPLIEFFNFLYAIRSLLRSSHDEAALAASSDMLLFQWGTYETDQRTKFHIDFTRQFVEMIKIDGEKEEVMSQLSVTCFYPMIAGTEHLGKGAFWCPSPRKSDRFMTDVGNSAPIRAFGSLTPDTVEIVWELV